MNFKKIKRILGVLFVFFLILATNLIDRHHFKKIQHSIETIYDDRLVAQGVIYDLTHVFQQKIMANTITDSMFYETTNNSINSEIDLLLIKYESTKLTSKEKNIFLNFKEQVVNLLNHEKITPNILPPDRTKTVANLNLIIQDLHHLAEIQLKEGSQVMKVSKESIRNIELLTRMEIYGLIALAIIIQLIIITEPKKKR